MWSFYHRIYYFYSWTKNNGLFIPIAVANATIYYILYKNRWPDTVSVSGVSVNCISK